MNHEAIELLRRLYVAGTDIALADSESVHLGAGRGSNGSITLKSR